MNLEAPFVPQLITQSFGGNANPLYAGQGLRGHTGTDFGAAWGVAVKAAATAPVAWIYNKNSPNLMNYRGVGQIVDGGDGFFYEVSYGHLSEIYVEEGDLLSQGAVLGRVGNTGACFVGQREITEAEKEAGSHAGAHLHFQVRKCVARKSSKVGKHESLITCSTGAYTLPDGRFVFAIDYDNGYNGCIDAVPFFIGAPVPVPSLLLTKDLYLGITDPQVVKLQHWLNTHGFPVLGAGAGSTGLETNYFGPMTQKALIKMQKAIGITPPAGYCGALTRSYINTNI